MLARRSRGGRAVESDGKSDAGEREIALDTFTLIHLRQYVERINDERHAFEGSYPKHDYIMVGPEGRPIHPDTITARFNRLVDRASVPRIRLHDVRHTYSTMAQDAGHNVKILSERIGHADKSITMKIYTHRSQGIDRPLAQTMGTLIAQAAGITAPEAIPLVTDLVTDRPNADPDDGDPPLAVVG
ncbi:tyrosine-type recombinase/integrase [Kribbella kalugense]|uniref:tyrosine-type recombinase/integrase n=1 Tax=Kribbella kalugense TaxID=2512221 RepID=UPI0010668C07|nr:tyrosine-type recombinase/integrase [Kribbella kalugense]